MSKQTSALVIFKNSQLAHHPGERHVVKASFDAAKTTDDNYRHWENADYLSADAAFNPAVRRTLVSRSRYEIGNNGYGNGIITTLANDAIGTGPRLQLQLADTKRARRRELRFHQWMKKVKLSQKLRLARISKAESGEVFIVMITNKILTTKVKLDIVLYETDQVTSDSILADLETWPNGQPKEVDGICFDEDGNPTKYKFLKVHPGASTFAMREFIDVDADKVIHYGYIRRCGQHRGGPEITSTLPIFANLRRYRRSVLAAADNAALMATLFQTELLPDPEDSPYTGQPVQINESQEENYKAMEVLEFDHSNGVILPKGMKPFQLDAKQPTTTHTEFTDDNINEMARPFQMPFNVAKGNSSGYNYASGRLDHKGYGKAIRIERSDMADIVLDRIHEAWEAEDRIFYPADYSAEDGEFTLHKWFWDGDEHVDPSKEANAQDTHLANGSTNLANEYGKDGKDWETEMEQTYTEKMKQQELELRMLAERKKLMKKLDLSEEDLARADSAKSTKKTADKKSSKKKEDEDDDSDK